MRDVLAVGMDEEHAPLLERSYLPHVARCRSAGISPAFPQMQQRREGRLRAGGRPDFVRSGGLTLDLRDARKRPKSSSALVVAPHPRSECRIAWSDVKAVSTNVGEVLTSHKRPRLTVVEEKLDVQTHVAVEVERETKPPAAGRLVSSISCQHVTVIATPAEVHATEATPVDRRSIRPQRARAAPWGGPAADRGLGGLGRRGSAVAAAQLGVHSRTQLTAKVARERVPADP